MIEIGKKYMFDANTAKKNNVPNLYSGTQVSYLTQDYLGYWSLIGQLNPNPSLVLWTTQETFKVTYKDAFGRSLDTLAQTIRICRPYEKFEVTEMTFCYPGPLVFITKAMKKEGQELFESKYDTTTLIEIMNDLF